MSEQEQFQWGELGEEWWRENGAACRATEQQIRYACARHQGANKSRSATLAGYKGGPDALRSAGVRAEGTKAVEDLLTLAAAAESDGPTDVVGAAEIDRKLSKLIRSPDGAISLKAIEAHSRREEQRRARGDTPADDGYQDCRLARDFLRLPNGASAYVMLLYGLGYHLGSLPLLHDVHTTLMLEPDGPDLWRRLYEALSVQTREDLNRKLADPGWQLDARRKIWAEVGMKPLGPIAAGAKDMLARDGVASMINGGGEGAHAVA